MAARKRQTETFSDRMRRHHAEFERAFRDISGRAPTSEEKFAGYEMYYSDRYGPEEAAAIVARKNDPQRDRRRRHGGGSSQASQPRRDEKRCFSFASVQIRRAFEERFLEEVSATRYRCCVKTPKGLMLAVRGGGLQSGTTYYVDTYGNVHLRDAQRLRNVGNVVDGP